MGILDDLQGFAPEIAEDDSIDFSQPVRCGGIAVVKEGGRNTGIGKNSGDKFDFLTLKMQIGEVVDGEASAMNRFLDKSYSLMDKTWADGNTTTAADNVKRLLSDLFTAGYEFALPKTIDEQDLYEALAVHLGGLKDKLINVRCYPTKGGKQAVKIVKEIKKKSEIKKEKTNVPF